jgi:hypothetical protein
MNPEKCAEIAFELRHEEEKEFLKEIMEDYEVVEDEESLDIDSDEDEADDQPRYNRGEDQFGFRNSDYL